MVTKVIYRSQRFVAVQKIYTSFSFLFLSYFFVVVVVVLARVQRERKKRETDVCRKKDDIVGCDPIVLMIQSAGAISYRVQHVNT